MQICKAHFPEEEENGGKKMSDTTIGGCQADDDSVHQRN